MKPIEILVASGLAFAFLSPTPAYAAKKTPDFSALAGKYKGRGTLVAGVPLPIEDVIVKVKVSRNGRSASLAISGLLQPGGSPIPLSGTIKLSGKRKFSVDTLIFNVAPTTSAQGTFKVKSNETTFKAPWRFSVSSGTIKGDITPSGNGKTLKINYLFSIEGVPGYTYTFKTKRKGK